MKCKRFISLVLLLLAGCAIIPESPPEPEPTPVVVNTSPDALPVPEESPYISTIAPKDCCLCGDRAKEMFSFYWQQKNLMVFNLNTLESYPITLNLYGENKKPLEKFAGCSSLAYYAGQDNSFKISIWEVFDRGYGNGTLSLNQNAKLDIEKAASALCEDCLNEVLSEKDTNYYAVGLLDLSTMKMKLFEEGFPYFSLGDFYIDCYPKSSTDPSMETEAGLSIFYCPIRYPKYGHIK